MHVGCIVAYFMLHQSQHKRIGVLFLGSYIIRLIRMMGLIEHVRNMDIVSIPTPLGLATLKEM